VFPVVQKDAVYDKQTQKAIAFQVNLVGNGVWEQTWNVESLSAEEQDNAVQHASSMARELAKHHLFISDWTQVADAPFTDEKRAAWTAYRQALRDVNKQPGFPWTIDWPVAP
jgi:hypothetical protein